MNSVYPIWWDSTITIFNKFEDSQTHVIKWFKTILPKCFWKQVGGTMTAGTTVIDTQSITCRIPQNAKYLSPQEYYSKPNDEMGEYFTLAQGDLIFLGALDDTIDEYTKGKHSTDLIAKYKKSNGVLEIKDIAIDVHTGLITPHYRVSGL